MKPYFAKIIAILVLLLAAEISPLLAIIVIGGPDNPSGQNLGAPPDGLGQYVGEFGASLGVPISPTLFLTSFHVGSEGGVFNFNNGTTTATQYAVSLLAVQNDLAVWQITNPNQVFSLYAPLYTSSTMIGQSLVTIGRGTARGDPITNTLGQLAGWQWGTANDQISWGTNTVGAILTNPSGVTGTYLYFTFDNNPANPNNANQAIFSGGDSGGEVFVQDPSGNYELAGINYGVDTVSQSGALFDTYGYYDGGTLITQPIPEGSYATDISSELPFLHSLDSLLPVPEPSSLWQTMIVALGVALASWWARRRKKAWIS